MVSKTVDVETTDSTLNGSSIAGSREEEEQEKEEIEDEDDPVRATDSFFFLPFSKKNWIVRSSYF